MKEWAAELRYADCVRGFPRIRTERGSGSMAPSASACFDLIGSSIGCRWPVSERLREMRGKPKRAGTTTRVARPSRQPFSAIRKQRCEASIICLTFHAVDGQVEDVKVLPLNGEWAIDIAQQLERVSSEPLAINR